MKLKKSTALATGVLTAGIVLGGAGSASATTINETAASWSTCDSANVVRPFTAYDDSRAYMLAPGGSFEGGAAGWQFSSTASVRGQTERFYLSGSMAESKSLDIPAGQAAISPAMCVDLDYLTMRLVTLASSGAKLRVEVIYPNSTDPTFKEVGILSGGQGTHEQLGWFLSDDIALLPELGGAEWGARLAALRLTAVTGDWRIDSLYVDPRRH